jgi:predicted AlkP superfamily pyrophosphatase or phosphodiesterase
MRKFILATAALLCACRSEAQPQAALAPGAPKLLIVISVDQFSADLWDEYRPQFSGGFARLASGTVFHNGYQSHAATETCPGHSTILTGDRPARTGIISNLWVDQTAGRADVNVYCAEDETVPGSSSTSYTVSPKHLMVATFGELMKARWADSRNVAVSGKDRAAVMMSGHHPDQRWYWTGEKFETDLAGAPVPQVLPRVNAAIATALAKPLEPLDPPSFCQARSQVIPIPGGAKPVGAGRFARAAGDVAAFRASPELDGDTLALAAGLIDELKLGRGSQPDVLSISLSATDYVGHAYGTEGQEMCLQLLALDRELGDFLAVLDSRGISYAVALTADHGGQDIPERRRLSGVADAARIDPALSSIVMGPKLAGGLGLPGPGLLGGNNFGDMYVDRKLPQADRKRLLAAAVAAYRAHPQVEAVFTGDQIAVTPMPATPPDQWSLIERARASYYPGRSGDFVVVLKRNITPIADTSRYVATHGSPWDYDRRVPIIFWRPGMAPSTREEPIETVDIMPTLAAQVGLPIASGSIDGKCLATVAACRVVGPTATERGKR